MEVNTPVNKVYTFIKTINIKKILKINKFIMNFCEKSEDNHKIVKNPKKSHINP